MEVTEKYCLKMLYVNIFQVCCNWSNGLNSGKSDFQGGK